MSKIPPDKAVEADHDLSTRPVSTGATLKAFVHWMDLRGQPEVLGIKEQAWVMKEQAWGMKEQTRGMKEQTRGMREQAWGMKEQAWGGPRRVGGC